MTLPALPNPAYQPTTLMGRRTFAWHRYIPHKPTTQQAAFLKLDALEALYGGAAGGGKSDALLMDALQDVMTPGYSAILFRRTYQDLSLPGALLERSRQWLEGTDAHWDGVKKQWRFPSGAILAFGYLDTDADRFRYQSAEFQFIGWDELTQFPEGWYRYLLSRLRRLKSMDVPVRSRGATNPGGIGHEWVKRRFLQEDRPFVPAKLADNPHLDAEGYRASLAQLDSVTRKQLEEGEWVQDASGLLFPEFNAQIHCIEAEPAGLTSTVIALDFGTASWNALAEVGWRENDPTTYILRAYQFKGLSEEAANETESVSRVRAPHRVVGDVGGLGKSYSEEMRRRFGIPVVPAQKNDKLGYIRLLNGALKAGTIKVVRPACADLVHQWSTLPKDPKTGMEVAGFDNHASDAALYGWRESFSYVERPKATEPAYGTPEWYAAEETAMREARDEQVRRRLREEEERNPWD